MQQEIVLSSHSVKDVEDNKPEDFTTNFTRPIVLDNNKQYVIGLNRVISMSFTWFNVNAGYKNQLIKYSSDNGLTFKDITIPAGVWNYTDFNTYIENLTGYKIAGDKYTSPITIEFDDTTFRVTIVLADKYQNDLRASNFNDLIGFDKKILVSGTHIGSRVPNLSQDRNTQYSL